MRFLLGKAFPRVDVANRCQTEAGSVGEFSLVQPGPLPKPAKVVNDPLLPLLFEPCLAVPRLAVPGSTGPGPARLFHSARFSSPSSP